MPRIHRHALVSHSARRMFDLVNDVAAYPRRFDWCEASEVLSESDDEMVARLALRAAGLRMAFTTRNALQPPTTTATTGVRLAIRPRSTTQSVDRRTVSASLDSRSVTASESSSRCRLNCAR